MEGYIFFIKILDSKYLLDKNFNFDVNQIGALDYFGILFFVFSSSFISSFNKVLISNLFLFFSLNIYLKNESLNNIFFFKILFFFEYHSTFYFYLFL